MIQAFWNTLFNPGKGIQEIESRSLYKSSLFLVIIGAIVSNSVISTFLMAPHPSAYVSLFIFFLVQVLLNALFTFFIFSKILQITGKWMGGKGTWRSLSMVVGWATIPGIVFSPIFALLYYFAGQASFGPTSNPLLTGKYLIAIKSISILPGIWAFIVYLFFLSHIHAFSKWKAFFNYFVSSLIVMAIVYGIKALNLSSFLIR